MKQNTQVRTFKLWTYDVWGNAKDGFQVNDRYGNGLIRIRCKAKTFNAGTPQEFVTFNPTDRQLSRAVGERGLEWEGESDYSLYATLKSNGKPVCELCNEDEDGKANK